MEKNLVLGHIKVIVAAVAAWVMGYVQQAIDGIDKFVLPAAGKDQLGGIKAGEGLTVAADGTASVDFTSANAYADSAAANAAKDATEKVDKILKDAPEAFDTLKEVADYINQNDSVQEALQQAIGDKLGKDELVYATDEEVEAAVAAALEEL